MKKLIISALLIVMGSTAAMAQWQRQPDYGPGGLKDAYKDYFTIGVAVNKRNISNADQIALIKKEFNSITAENDRWDPCTPRRACGTSALPTR